MSGFYKGQPKHASQQQGPKFVPTPTGYHGPNNNPVQHGAYNTAHPATTPNPTPRPASGVPQSALDVLKHQLNAWGLGTLYHRAVQFLREGITQDSAALQIEFENTPEWKARFAGNELRKKNGLAELDPGSYLSLEAQYRTVMQAYGLPKGFYDSHADFATMIGKGISPAELQTRVQVAHDQYMNAPQAMKNMWAQYYGMTPGDAIAGILDPKVATQVIQDRANAVAIGAAAAQQPQIAGVTRQRAEYLAKRGVTADQAQRAYGQISQTLGTDQQIAQRFGTSINQTTEENALLLDDGEANNKLEALRSQEKALFRGGNATDANTLGVSQEA